MFLSEVNLCGKRKSGQCFEIEERRQTKKSQDHESLLSGVADIEDTKDILDIDDVKYIEDVEDFEDFEDMQGTVKQGNFEHVG